MTHYLQQRALYPPLIKKRPSPLLGIVVVIPCHDEDFLQLSLLSLKRCKRPPCDVEVIVVINHSYNAAEEIVEKNLKTLEQTEQWIRENRTSHLRFHVLYMDELPPKHAGVGLARKIGMDEACYRFQKCRKPGGIIACFDADSRCDTNYLVALESYFRINPKAKACGIHFEHPLSGCEFDEDVYQAIALYELHLRYYIHAQRWAGFPHAWQTIGSSMAVRCFAYQQQGGMNRRKAGEDFYFLQKFIPLGNYGEITDTRVIPSPRPSHRVPFGTGKAVGEIIHSGKAYRTYNPKSFMALRDFLSGCIPDMYHAEEADNLYEKWPDCVNQFLKQNDFEEKLTEIRSHTSGIASFTKRFWQWFDAFMIMKFVHFARDHYYPDVDVLEAAAWMIAQEAPDEDAEITPDAEGMLRYFRRADRKSHHLIDSTH